MEDEEFSILPKFGELDAWTITLALIIGFILYPTSINLFLNSSKSIELAFGIILFGLALIVFFWYSIKYAWSLEIPSKRVGSFLGGIALSITVMISLFAAFVWYSQLMNKTDIVSRILIIFPILGIIRAMIFVFFMRRGRNYEDQFSYKNTSTNAVVISSAVAIITILVADFVLHIPEIIVINMAIENGVLFGRLGERKEETVI